MTTCLYGQEEASVIAATGTDAVRHANKGKAIDSVNLICEKLGTQKELNRFYLRELSSPSRFEHVPHPGEYAPIHRIEEMWNAYEESRLDLDNLPGTPAEFEKWYFSLHRKHRHDVAPFFDYLANEATIEELAFYISFEEQVDGRFDDVIALAQLGMTGDMKLALAENFWDEMGLGKLDDMHTVVFERSAAYLRQYLGDIDVASAIPAAALKNGNVLLMYALRRNYMPRLLGALAILEHTAPYRFSRTVRGLRRLGMPEDVIHYHELHIEVDANHGKQLFNRVLMPLVTTTPRAIREVCIGCLIRYQIACDYYQSVQAAMKAVLPSRVN